MSVDVGDNVLISHDDLADGDTSQAYIARITQLYQTGTSAIYDTTLRSKYAYPEHPYRQNFTILSLEVDPSPPILNSLSHPGGGFGAWKGTPPPIQTRHNLMFKFPNHIRINPGGRIVKRLPFTFIIIISNIFAESSDSPYRAEVVWFMRQFELPPRFIKGKAKNEQEIVLSALNYDTNIDLETVIEKCEVRQRMRTFVHVLTNLFHENPCCALKVKELILFGSPYRFVWWKKMMTILNSQILYQDGEFTSQGMPSMERNYYLWIFRTLRVVLSKESRNLLILPSQRGAFQFPTLREKPQVREKAVSVKEHRR